MRLREKVLDFVFPNRHPHDTVYECSGFEFRDSVRDSAPYKVLSVKKGLDSIFIIVFKLFGYRVRFRVRDLSKLNKSQKRFVMSIERFSKQGYELVYRRI